MKWMHLFFSFALLFFLAALTQGAQDYTHVISNSEDWKDVYSIMHYATLTESDKDFLVSTQHSTLLLNGLSKSADIRVVSSSESPFVINYPDLIRSQGFADVDELEIDNANIELLSELPEINNFIVVGRLYGYNAIAVAPYAVQSKSWVLFADEDSIAEIDGILSQRTVQRLIIYGAVDEAVRETLDKYNPEIIDTGDRFKDDIEIVKKYLALQPTDQVLLTNGEFIEKEIMSGAEPILFTGKENVPTQIQDYLRNSDIKVGVLVGSDLVGAATNIRRSTGISVIVKFARGARAPAGSIAAVEGLDLFYLPVPVLNLTIHSLKYNAASKNLEVTYKSQSTAPLYFRGTITLESDGETQRVGDAQAVFIAPGDYKTMVYSDLELQSTDDMSAEVFTLYGETPSSLEKILAGSYSISLINIIDRCDVVIEEVAYRTSRDTFLVKIANNAPVDCWVNAELSDIYIEGRKTTVSSEGATKVNAQDSSVLEIPQALSERDLERNSFVTIKAYYGEREESMVKTVEGTFPLSVEFVSMATIGLSALIIVLFVLILFFIWRRRREEQE